MNIKKEAGSAGMLNSRPQISKPIIPQKDKPVRIFTPQGMKFAGKICKEDGKNVFHKRVKEKLHFFRNLKAWGFQEEIISELDRNNVFEIVVRTEKAKIYKTTLSTLKKDGIRKDYGHGFQIFLPLKFWTETKTGNNQLSLLGDES